MSMVPYEKQRSERMCGAAALCMVYRALGFHVDQDEVWQAVQGKNGLGHPCGATHLLAVDALRRGLHALVLKANEPWPALTHCFEQARVILNHRAAAHSWTGHYTVPVQVGPAGVLLHDPQFGPVRRIARDDLIELWRRNPSPLCEISGETLLAIAADPGAPMVCATCATPVPESRTCPSCAREVPLRPAAVLGCLNNDCPANLWSVVFCPHCDATVYRRAETPLVGAEPSMAGQGRGGPPGLSAKLSDLTQLLGKAQEMAPEGPAREALNDLGRQLDLLHGQLRGVIQEHLDKSNETVDRLRANLVALKERIAEKKKPKPSEPAAVKPPRKKVDPELGQRLRQRLLHRLTARSTSSMPGSGEVWENWPT